MPEVEKTKPATTATPEVIKSEDAPVVVSAPTAKVETIALVVAKVAPPIVEAAKVTDEVPKSTSLPLAPESNPRLSHKDRIVAFLDARKGAGKVKLNDFIKSLFPLSREAQAGHTVQGNMKKLKLDLTQLTDEGKIRLTSNSFERLGKAHFPDNATGKTHYYDVTNVVIEAEV